MGPGPGRQRRVQRPNMGQACMVWYVPGSSVQGAGLHRFNPPPICPPPLPPACAQVVRAVLWPGASGGVCLSGGEDSRICVWQLLAPGQAPPQRMSGSTSSSDGAVRKQGAHLHRRKAPY